MFLVNSRPRHCSATLLGFESESLHLGGRPFSRSYGTILPSSLTRVLSSALEHLLPPTRVGLRYGLRALNLEAFLGSLGSVTSALRHGLASRPSPADLPTGCAYTLALASNSQLTYPSASPHRTLAQVREYSPVFHRLRVSASP